MVMDSIIMLKQAQEFLRQYNEMLKLNVLEFNSNIQYDVPHGYMPTTILEYEALFAFYRQSNNTDKLIEFLTRYSMEKHVHTTAEGINREKIQKSIQSKKTFSLDGTRHTFHSLWAYVPNPQQRTRKNLALQKVKNDFSRITLEHRAYYDVRVSFILDQPNTCPCELFQSVIDTYKSHKLECDSKLFNVPVPVMNKENQSIEQFLCQYNIIYKTKYRKNYKRKADKKDTSSVCEHSGEKVSHEISIPDCLQTENVEYENIMDTVGMTTISRIDNCQHKYSKKWEQQERAGDEMVSIYTQCEYCKHISKIQ
jgi:hypothetical protein